MTDPIGFEIRKATSGDFLEDGYLSINPDVRVAVAQRKLGSGRKHFDLHGRDEGRLQRVPLGPLRDVRKMKIHKLRPLLRADMPMRQRDGKLDFLTPELRDAAGLAEVENVSSHNYDEVALGIIDKHADGLVLDCGAGRRDWYFPNVVNYEIVDYDSTDVLGVGEELPFVDGAFDAVISVAVLEHVRDPFRCAKELARVLKPSGELFCCMPLLQPVHAYPHHYFNATPQGLCRLFESDIAVEEGSLTPIHPLWAISWVLNSWSQALPESTRARFRDMPVGALTGQPLALLDEPFAAELPREKQLELACATVLVAKKRALAAAPPKSAAPSLIERLLWRYMRKSSPR
ncbi:class I SAM-dependent methyltransferase [Methylocystis sp. SB2]|uniref:class I SAM-dependent methyltransferase n=1 Tax=Methylocystis sp. (strain SB2) TaxID=743836 RepID=UPI000419E495|nr:class I SAM-dependent methyltransferase [Methylocystis sp. SB2]ULO22563.1 class I SAM-dependent methyltransferase [Methylocystis sp. SB2]